jgi:hypothetical protein
VSAPGNELEYSSRWRIQPSRYLFTAGSEGYYKIVQLLLDYRVDVDANGYEIQSTLFSHLVSVLLRRESRDWKFKQLLLDKGTDINYQG